MSRRGRRAATRRGGALAFAVSLVGLALVGAPAADARGLKTGLQDGLFESPDATVRAQWLDEAVSERADIVRINASWRGAVESRRPATPTDPADPAYDFGSLDAAVRDARARGLDVLLTVLSAPDWAEGGNRPDAINPGTWKPNRGDLADFAQALATRYSGAFLDLPRVRFFQAWNEPNLEFYLAPQWSQQEKPRSPNQYRRMLNAFYAGVKSAQPDAKVVTGGTAPYGNPPGKSRMRPIAFLRGLFCLNRRLKPVKCPAKPRFDVLAHHPITTSGGPHRKAINPGDAAMADFHKVRRVLRAAERAGHVRPRGRHQLWATELWWSTDPPNRRGVPVRKHARWIATAFYLLWRQGASVAINLQIRDDQYFPRSPTATLQSGLFFFDGKPKPSARSFRFPFVTQRRSARRIVAWGKAPRAGALQIQVKARRGWRTRARLRVERGQVFQRGLRLRGKRRLRAIVGGEPSLVWRQRG